VIAFFDYPDVFEDFYPHYGIDQRTFATRWATTGSHAFLSLVQRDIGDVTWYSFSLAPDLTEARHEVVGCRVRILPSSWLHRRLWRWFYLPRMAWRWRGMYPAYAAVASYVSLLSWRFVRSLLAERPDVLFVTDYATGRFDVLCLLAWMLGCPLVARHAGSVPDRYIGRAAKRWTIPRASKLIASSREELEMLATRYGVPPDRLAVILTPIDVQAFCPLDRAVACRDAGLDPARRYVVFMGRLDRVKRVDAIIRCFAEAAAKHADAELLIVGEGPEKAALVELAATHGRGRIRFLGWISDVDAKARLYTTAECLVLNSRKEGFPRVVAEAMACGTPVLSSRVGGVAELVAEGETGWLFAPGDERTLTQRLEFVLAEPAVVAAMRPRARLMAERRVAPAAITEDLRRCFDPRRG
jgi:glycosyltransferase involved in cell wall biosynthesis